MVVESFNIEYDAPEKNGAFLLRCIESIAQGDPLTVLKDGVEKPCMAHIFDYRWKMHSGVTIHGRNYSLSKAILEFYFKHPDIVATDKNCSFKGVAVNCLTDYINAINTSAKEWDDVKEFFDGTLDIDFVNDPVCVEGTFDKHNPIRQIACLHHVIDAVHPDGKPTDDGTVGLNTSLMVDIFDSIMHDFTPGDYAQVAPNTTKTWLQLFGNNAKAYVYLIDKMMQDPQYRDLMRMDDSMESSAMRDMMTKYAIPPGKYTEYVMADLIPYVFGAPSDKSVASIVESVEGLGTEFTIAWLKYCAAHDIDIAEYSCQRRDGSVGSCLSRLIEPQYYPDGSMYLSYRHLYKALLKTPEIHRGTNFKVACKRGDGSETSCIDHVLSWYADEVAQHDKLHRLENRSVMLDLQRWGIRYSDPGRDKKIARLDKLRTEAESELRKYKDGDGADLWYDDVVADVRPTMMMSVLGTYGGRRVCRRDGMDAPVSCIDKVIDTYAHHVMPIGGSRDEEFVNLMYDTFTITGKECSDDQGNRISCIQRLFDIFENKDESVTPMKKYLLSKFGNQYSFDQYDFRVHDGQQMQPVPNAWYILHAAKKIPKAKRCDIIGNVSAKIMMSPDLVQKLDTVVPGSRVLTTLSDCVNLRDMYDTIDSSERAKRRRQNPNTTNGQVSMSGEALTLATKTMCDQTDPKSRRICADKICWQMMDVKKSHGTDDARKWIGDDAWGMTNQEDSLGICGVYTVAVPANVKDTAMGSYKDLIAKVNDRLRSVVHNKLVSGVCVSPVVLQVTPMVPDTWGYDMPTIRVVLSMVNTGESYWNNPYARLDSYDEWASCADEDGIVASVILTYEELAGMPLPSYVNYTDVASTRIVNGVTIDRSYVCRLLQRLIDDEDQQIRAVTAPGSDDVQARERSGRSQKSLKQMIATAVTSRPSMETELKMVISRRPYDLMRASTCQEWSSCFNLDDGGYAYTTKMYLDSGAYIVYLAPDEFSTTWLCRAWMLTSAPDADGAPKPCVSVQPVYGLTEYKPLLQAAIDTVLAQHGVNRPYVCDGRMRKPGWDAVCERVVASAIDQCIQHNASAGFTSAYNSCVNSDGWKKYVPVELDTYRDICDSTGRGHPYWDTQDVGEVGRNRLADIRDEFGRQVTFGGFPKKVEVVRNRAPLG